MLRDCAEEIKKFIEADEVLHHDGHVTVIVEDKASVSFDISNAIAQTGVAVMIAVTGFTRVEKSAILHGDLEIQISCYEHPELNRDDLSVLTAQGVAERIANILHYATFPFFIGQMIFKDFSRDDTDEVNIVRSNFTVSTRLGFEDAYFADQTTPTE